jgi:hypothetical protein
LHDKFKASLVSARRISLKSLIFRNFELNFLNNKSKNMQPAELTKIQTLSKEEILNDYRIAFESRQAV